MLASGLSELPETDQKSGAAAGEEATTNKNRSGAQEQLPSYNQGTEKNQTLIADPVPARRTPQKQETSVGLSGEIADQEQHITSNDPPSLGYDTSQREYRARYDVMNQNVAVVMDRASTGRRRGIHLAGGTFKELEYGEKAVFDAGTIIFTEDKSSAAVPSMKIQSTGWNYRCKGKTVKDCILKEGDWSANEWESLIDFQAEKLQVKLTPTEIRRTERELTRVLKAEDQANRLTATEQHGTLETARLGEKGKGSRQYRGGFGVRRT